MSNKLMSEDIILRKKAQYCNKTVSTTPKKTKIHLRQKHNRIPQIEIKLDEVLSDVYSEIKKSKNINKIPTESMMLNNDLIKQYVSFIYGEYQILDPIGSEKWVYQQSTSQEDFCQSIPYTPKKTSVFQANVEKNSTARKSRSKTLEKIKKMKNDFQVELHSNQIQSSRKLQNDQYHFSRMQKNLQQPHFPISKTIKKVHLKPKHKMVNKINYKNISPSSPFSYLLSKTKFNYCLICQQPLQDNAIFKHEENCDQLKSFLSQKILSKKELTNIIEEKIKKIEQQLHNEMKMDEKSFVRFQTKIKNILSRPKTSDEFKIQGERQQLKQFFSGLNLVKYFEKMDKLEWFKLMRARAEGDRPIKFQKI